MARHAVVPGFADFRDDDDAPFRQSVLPAFATPQATAAEILLRFSDIVFGVMKAASRRPLPIRLDDLVRWHRGIFKPTFPHYAGEVRRGAELVRGSVA